jgi:hypothetical protein
VREALLVVVQLRSAVLEPNLAGSRSFQRSQVSMMWLSAETTTVPLGSGAPCGGISRSRGQAMVVPAAEGTDVGMVIDMAGLRVPGLCRSERKKVSVRRKDGER